MADSLGRMTSTMASNNATNKKSIHSLKGALEKLAASKTEEKPKVVEPEPESKKEEPKKNCGCAKAEPKKCEAPAPKCCDAPAPRCCDAPAPNAPCCQAEAVQCGCAEPVQACSACAEPVQASSAEPKTHVIEIINSAPPAPPAPPVAPVVPHLTEERVRAIAGEMAKKISDDANALQAKKEAAAAKIAADKAAAEAHAATLAC